MKQWPLVGRENELELITSGYDSGADRRGAGGVVLIGAPGVGKTRLAREAMARLARRGGVVAWATATRSAAVIPLGALTHLLASAIRPADGPAAGPELSVWDPIDWAGDGPVISDEPVADPTDAFGSLVAWFAGRSGPRPVLIVDDVHLLDDASAGLVHHLAIHGYAYVVLTTRPGAATPDAVTALWTGEVAQRVDVPLLDEESIGALLAAEFGGCRLDAISETELRRICAGNPMLLRELLHAGRQTGALSKVGEVWRWISAGYVTPRLSDVVAERLGALRPRLRTVVELLACAEPLAVAMLIALASGSAAVAAAERRGLVVVERSGARLVARLAHPVYADVIRAGLPHSREREIWRLLAEALDGTPVRRRDDVLLAAQWRLDAGLPTRPELLLAAAEFAMDRLDLGLAERLARAASGAASGVSAGPQAGLVLAEVLVHKGRYEEAAEALPPSDVGIDREVRSRWLVAHHRIRYWGAGRAPQPLAGPEAQPPADPDGEPGDPSAEAARSWLLVFSGQGAQAIQVGQQALASAAIRPEAADWASAAVVTAAGLLGDHERAMTVLHSGLARAARNRDAHAWGSAQVGGAGCIALLAAGRLAEARDLADQGYREAVGMAGVFSADATPIVGAWAAIRGIVAKAQGRVGPALSALAEAAALLDNWPTFRMNRVYLAEQAGAHALGADTVAAADQLERADRLGDAPGVLFDAWVERDRAWVTAASGDRHTAANQAHHAADLARDSGQPTIEALALFDAARLGDPQVRGRLSTIARTLGGAIVPTLASVAEALHPERDGDPLDEASRRLAALGQYLYAAEAAAAAYRIHARTGRRSRGQAALTRALALARACEGARAPLLGLIGLHAVLTARELHIACMAAAGASSPKIAARLGLSVRTVDNHLGRVYTKLGVTGRIQLADALVDMPDAWSD